jgi:hypothetical protein
MNNFVQATEHEVYMYAKIQCINMYRYLQRNTLEFEFF